MIIARNSLYGVMTFFSSLNPQPDPDTQLEAWSRFVISISVEFAQFRTVCTTGACQPSALTPANVRELGTMGLSAGFFAGYVIVVKLIFAATSLAVGVLIFWRKSDERMALFVALALVTYGLLSFVDHPDAVVAAYPALGWSFTLVSFMGNIFPVLFFYLFPDGRFVPRWTGVVAILLVVLGVCVHFFPDSSLSRWLASPPGLVLSVGFVATGVFAQLYRYRRVSGPVERQQTKWVVFGATTAMVKEALKLPYVAIQLRRQNGFETAAAAGEPVDRPLEVPLIYGGETVGRLILGPRAGEENFAPADRRLLDDLAHQIGVAAHAVRLTDEALRLSADLQRSRERLVTAREEERRRLRRDLHDGLGLQLASLTMTAEVARDLISTDPERAEELLGGLMERAQAAVSDVRHLVYALRPPALDALGLLWALRAHADHHDNGGIQVTIDAPEQLPPLPAAVEVASYRIALEAINNAERHADARSCAVRISLDNDAGALRVEIVDDGRGIGEDRGTGVGLSSMRERAAELGGWCAVEALASGGTRVRAYLPCGGDSGAADDMTKREAPGE